MIRPRFALGILIFTLYAEFVPAQEQQDPIYLLLDKAYRVKVTAKIIGTDEELVWDMETTYITISGRTVTIPLKGNNLVVLVHITPYQEKTGEILLVAQGQVWYTSGESQEVKYLSTLKSLPLQLGEKLLFFPLGNDKVADSKSNQSSYDNIVLQVQILPYREQKGN